LKQQEGKITYDLKGKTLQVYLYLMRKNEPSGIREVQRDLNLSSPSVASYQIEKLIDLGLVGKDVHGRYHLLHKVHVPSLKAYVNIGKFMVPRLTFYAGFFTALLSIYIILNISSLNVFAIAFGLIGTGVFWYEAFRVWKMSPATLHIDISDVKPFVTENRNEMVPYIALGLVLIVAGTAGFDMFSNLVTGYIEDHPEIYDPNSIDIENINTNIDTYPADRIGESVLLSREKMNHATQEDAYGPGVPVISEESFSILAIVLPFAGAVTAASVVYTIAKTRQRVSSGIRTANFNPF
jgi:hypothetical protein